MKSKAALNVMLARSGMADTALSESLGKSPNYISATKSGKSTPSVDKFAAIADACGFDTLARSRETGEEIVIDPPGD